MQSYAAKVIRWAAVLLVAGCGRVHFAPLTDAGLDAEPESPCWAAWRSGAPQISTPRMMTELDITTQQGDPSLSSDGLTLYFSAGTLTTFDIYRSMRAGLDQPWQAPVLVSELSTPMNDLRLSMNSAGTIAVLSSDRTGSSMLDLWYTERTDPTAMWSAPTQTLVAGLNTLDSEHNPELTADGRSLYFAPDTTPKLIMRATRASITDPLGAAVPVAELNLQSVNVDPTLSPDERVVAFAATGASSIDLSFATRDDSTSPFGTPQLIPRVNAPTNLDNDPELSADGCELYYTSNRSNGFHLYIATVTP